MNGGVASLRGCRVLGSNPRKSDEPLETMCITPSADMAKGWETEVQWKSMPPVGWGGEGGGEGEGGVG